MVVRKGRRRRWPCCGSISRWRKVVREGEGAGVALVWVGGGDDDGAGQEEEEEEWVGLGLFSGWWLLVGDVCGWQLGLGGEVMMVTHDGN